LVAQIGTFFKTGIPPINPEESLEVIAFMEAATLSKGRSGVAVPLSEIMR
jgi:hypothetical protein